MKLRIFHECELKFFQIQTGLPTFVPGGSLGLFGTVTEISSPPKNRQSLFDYAFSGPIVGLILSIGLLFLGLLETVSTDTSALSTYPVVNVEFLKLSTMVSFCIWISVTLNI